jgi:hypothetical protein
MDVDTNRKIRVELALRGGVMPRQVIVGGRGAGIAHNCTLKSDRRFTNKTLIP